MAQWLRSIGSKSPELVVDVAVDAQGNLYSVGSFADVPLTPQPGASALENAGRSDVFVTRHAPTGELSWARRFGGAMPDAPRGLGVDARGHVYVTGYFLGDLTVCGGEEDVHALPAVGGADAFLIELDRQGRVAAAWSWGGKWGDSGNAVAVDRAGNLYLAGAFELTVDFDPGPGRRLLTSRGRKDAFLLKLDRQGRLQWVLQFGGAGEDTALKLAVDATGPVYVAGSFEGEARFGPHAQGQALTAEAHADLFLLKVSPHGKPLWSQHLVGSGVDRLAGLGADRTGRVVMAGSFQGSLEVGSGDDELESAGGGYDLFVARWKPSGELEWARRMGGEQTDLAQGLSVAPGGEALIVGYFQGSTDFDPGPDAVRLQPVEEGNVDGFAVALDAAGRYRWAWRIGEAGVEQVFAGALGPSGEAYLAGVFSDTLGTMQSQGKSDVFLVKLRPPD